MAEVYWTSRDLDGPPWGNHQFILVHLGATEYMQKIKAEESGGQRFVTLGGHVVGGNLTYIANQKADVASVKEVLDPSTATGWSDYDMEKHKLTPPSGSGWDFAWKLETLANNYEKNTATTPVDYDLWDRNCATWVNTMLKVAGVSDADRQTAGEFNGIDWGEEDMINEDLFK